MADRTTLEPRENAEYSLTLETDDPPIDALPKEAESFVDAEKEDETEPLVENVESEEGEPFVDVVEAEELIPSVDSPITRDDNELPSAKEAFPKHEPVVPPRQHYFPREGSKPMTSSRKRKRIEMESPEEARNVEDRIMSCRYMMAGLNAPGFMEKTIGTELMADTYRFVKDLTTKTLSIYPALSFQEIYYPNGVGLNEQVFGYKPKHFSKDWINICDTLLQWRDKNSPDILQFYNIWMYINTADENIGYVYIHSEDENDETYTMGFVINQKCIRTIRGLDVSEVYSIRQILVNYIYMHRCYASDVYNFVNFKCSRV